MSSDPRIGTQVGAYRIEEVIGRGGMGVVYLAEHLRLKKRMALKILPPELADDDEFRRRFERESQMAAALDHPNIVAVHDAGEIDGTLYLAMRYVQGTDLARVLAAGGSLPLQRALGVLGQVADALDEAHTAGLVHRDVKPANILIDQSRGRDRAYLSDFGLAKQWTSGSRFTRSGFFLGTIAYAAPEQLMGEAVDGRADVYSLGCVLFECLTGQVPFPRPHEPAVMYAHLQDSPPVVTDVRPEVPAGLNGVLARAMAKDREERYATCGGLVAAARDALEGRVTAPVTVAVAPATRPSPAATPGGTPFRTEPATEPGVPTEPVERGGTGRSRGLIIGGALVLAAALGVGGFFLFRQSGTTSGANDGPTPDEGPTDGTTSPQVRELRLVPISATATSTAEPGMDACGNPVPFEADDVTDGDPTTAWRTLGDGRNEEVTLTFPQAVHITRVGLIPGYAKTDPCDGTDRFTENRIIKKVLYLDNEGGSAVQELEPVPEVQYLDVDLTGTELTVSIRNTTEHGGRDYTAISEVEVYGEAQP